MDGRRTEGEGLTERRKGDEGIDERRENEVLSG